MQAPYQSKNHFVSLFLAILFLLLIYGAATRFEFLFPPEEPWRPASPETVNDDWQVVLSNEEADPIEGGLFVTVRIHTFHDLNLDGLRGDPELTDGQVRLYNVANYNDTRLFTENPLVNDEVRLCYSLTCKSPDQNGTIEFNIPKFIFDSSPGITLRMDHRPGRFAYYTFNDPFTVLGRLENQTIILTPQHSGSGEIFLPTAAVYDEFKIGFSPYPCVLPFDESVTAELLPMNFFDFDPNVESIINFDGEAPRQLKEFDTSLGNYNSDNHSGLDFYYPRKERIVRYSCVMAPEFLTNSSSDESGNLVFSVRTPLEGDFLISFGHLAAPAISVMEMAQIDADLPQFGDSFAVVGSAGTSIIHLHLSFGDFIDPVRSGGDTYCFTPPFPYYGGDLPYPGIQPLLSQRGEQVCADYDNSTYLAHQFAAGSLYAPFIPSIPLAALQDVQ